MRANTPRNTGFAVLPLWMLRALIWVLCGTLSQPAVWSQSGAAVTDPANAAPRRLQLQILTPVPLTEPAGGLSANRIAVQVLDEWGHPVPRATVSFRLPEAGPGGVFMNGLSTEVVIADDEGKASVQGFDWREDAGSTFMHVIAAYGAIRAGAMVEIQLGRRAPRGLTPSTSPPPEIPVVGARMASSRSQEPTAVAPAPRAPRQTTESQPQVVDRVGRTALPTETNRAAVLDPVQHAPRESVQSAPDVDYQAPRIAPRPVSSDRAAAREQNSFVTVKKAKGGNKAMLFLVIAGAAAGGALAVGMASGKGSSSGNNPGSPSAPAITIGNPTITVSGGN